jgi:hypothetical protein
MPMKYLLAVVLASALVAACQNDRGGDVPEIRAGLERIPQVRVIDVVGWDSMWPIAGPENIRADLRVGNDGRLVLCDLSPETFSGSRPFMLARVGEWVPSVLAERDMGRMRFVAGCPNSVDIGPGSSFLDLVPFPLRSPGDVVAHYDELHQLIASWPDRPTRCPGKDGKWISYHKVPVQEPTH